ncbi:MAG: citryl-CoA lyase [Gammaproteobacteria bacterium]|nr:citryl-CoA lyase [Gammaproteobacteria bacterium]
MTDKQEQIRSRIWLEEAEADNPFAAQACYCSGYDVYADILPKATWAEYIYLLFTTERASPEQAQLLEKLAIAIANPGLRDHSVRAAMNGGVGGSHAAACLMAALGVGAGQLNGAHEVRLAMKSWQQCKSDIKKWCQWLTTYSQQARKQEEEQMDAWQAMAHAPGFDPHGNHCAQPVRQTLDCLTAISPGDALPFLNKNRAELEQASQHPLAMSGVAAAALIDLKLDPAQGEMLYLMLRLPGAAVHALEQQQYGWRDYPFFGAALKIEDDPGPVPNT